MDLSYVVSTERDLFTGCIQALIDNCNSIVAEQRNSCSYTYVKYRSKKGSIHLNGDLVNPQILKCTCNMLHEAIIIESGRSGDTLLRIPKGLILYEIKKDIKDEADRIFRYEPHPQEAGKNRLCMNLFPFIGKGLPGNLCFRYQGCPEFELICRIATLDSKERSETFKNYPIMMLEHIDYPAGQGVKNLSLVAGKKEQKLLLPFSGLVTNILIELRGDLVGVPDRVRTIINQCLIMDLDREMIEIFCNPCSIDASHTFFRIPIGITLTDLESAWNLNRGNYYLEMEFSKGSIPTSVSAYAWNRNIILHTKFLHFVIRHEIIIRVPTPGPPLTVVDKKSFIEGYWFDGDYVNNGHLPIPIVGQEMVDSEFITKLSQIVEACVGEQYLGCSRCRVCGLNNGSKEYHISNGDISFRFPEGIMHYYVEHKVQPSDKFREFVMNIKIGEMNDMTSGVCEAGKSESSVEELFEGLSLSSG